MSQGWQEQWGARVIPVPRSPIEKICRKPIRAYPRTAPTSWGGSYNEFRIHILSSTPDFGLSVSGNPSHDSVCPRTSVPVARFRHVSC
eukprot:3389953-Prymnesium_polylepis.1